LFRGLVVVTVGEVVAGLVVVVELVRVVVSNVVIADQPGAEHGAQHVGHLSDGGPGQ
jgi:hypothetical protein